MSAEEITQAIGIRVEAVTEEAKRKATELAGAWTGLGKAIEKAKAEQNNYGLALKNASKAPITAITREVEKLTPLLSRAKEQTKELATGFDRGVEAVGKFLVSINLIQGAIKLVGNYLEGAFARAKLDPALEGLDRLRKRTEQWTTEWEGRIDRILSKIAGAAIDAYDKDESTRFTASAVGRRRGIPQIIANRAFREITGHGFNPQGDSNDWDISRQQKEAGIYRALLLQAMQQQDAEDAAAQAGNRAGIAQAGLGGVYGSLFVGGTARGARPGRKPGSTTPDRYLTHVASEWTAGIGSGAAQGAWGEAAGNFFTGVGGIADDAKLYGGSGMYDDAVAATQAGMPSGPEDLSDKRLGRFAAQLQDQSTLVGGAFATMSAGITAAVEAAISGSDSIGRAFLKASAMVLKSIAVESAARAAFELAMGLGSAYFNPPAAAAHFAAAAQFAIAAGVAGAGSAVISAAGAGGGRASPSTPAGGGGGFSGGSSRDSGGTTIIVQVGHGFVGGRAGMEELGAVVSDALRTGTTRSRVGTRAVTVR